MSRLWSGRFEREPDPSVLEFGSSFAFDRRLFEDDVVGSLAWVAALGDAGVLTELDVDAITKGLNEILELGRQNPAFIAGDDEDVHSFVERQLVLRAGETGKRLHTGRSRNEQVSLDLRMYLRRRITALQTVTRELVTALVDQADAAGHRLMPAYTHLRRAQPVLVAHFWLSHVAALRRDHDRLAAARDEADVLPLGSGALAGTAYPLDTAALAARLGFSRVAVNSLDAVADRDFVSTFLHASSLIMVHLSRLAEDVIIFGTEEFGFIGLDDSVTTGSSLMPQKKNPDPLELIRGKCGRVIGTTAGWLASMKGLPSGYNKDLQEDKQAVFDTEDTVRGCLETTAAVVRTLTVSEPRTTQAAGGLMLATDVADYLVSRGMPFRAAHETVGLIVRRLLDQGREFHALTLEEWRSFSELFDADVSSVVTPEHSVAAKWTPQSTRPDAVRAAIAEARRWLASEK